MSLIPELQRLWQRFVTMGASDNDIHQLIEVAQDMECGRIALVLRSVADRVRATDPRAASLLDASAEHFELKQHRALGAPVDH